MMITDWMVENGIAKNVFNANAIFNGLQLKGLTEKEQQARCLVYREWRRAGENTHAAFTAAIKGENPPARLIEAEQ